MESINNQSFAITILIGIVTVVIAYKFVYKKPHLFQDEEVLTGDEANKKKPSSMGCKHYERSCMKQCPNSICEGKFYSCRFCHDEVMFDTNITKKNHQFERKRVTHVKCLRCGYE